MLQSIKSRVLCFYHACTTKMQSLISVHRDGDLVNKEEPISILFSPNTGRTKVGPYRFGQTLVYYKFKYLTVILLTNSAIVDFRPL